MTWQFGTILAADYWDGRLMVLARSSTMWSAIVLKEDDDPVGTPWEIGQIITLHPDNAGLRIVASPEETE